ncbi:LuxR C-terminal-related transcriptional regulator [Pseudonocardia kujensis]|uniref:helix-turn-helix transcriptional regulator n=1 Tax=Pseudonocardia kujensis TaxID=1128675 RepID=UPI001E5776FA|nr:LuxR C-terminal-related transcriptional regulator [Pseudonocardia kujensis]MCE0765363.1 LuxR C-terminal-related transcriptional regulator [Pseudonocardia kujensis]
MSEPDAGEALAGAPAARRLVRAIAADPGAGTVCDVVGPAGAGKSTTLRAVAAAWSTSVTVPAETRIEGDPDAPLVVDDAHELPGRTLDLLCERAARPGARLVVARRPWPRGPQLAALGAALSTHRPPLLLGTLDRTGVAARAARLLGAPAADALVEHVHTKTAGLPALVDRMLAEIVERIGPQNRARLLRDTPPGSVRVPVPTGLLDQLGHRLWALDARVRELAIAVALGAPLDAEVLVPLLGLLDSAGGGIDEVDELVEEARAAAVLTPSGGPAPLVTSAILRVTPEARRLEIRRTLAEIELDRGGSVLTAARGMLGTGATGVRSAEVFTAAGDELARTAADEDAGPFYAAAVAAGAPALPLASRRAEAAIRAGRLDDALAEADQVLSALDRVDVDDALRAGTVAAAVLAHRGMLARSAELYRWMAGAGAPTALAIPALVGTGALDEARAALRAPAPPAVPSGPPASAGAVLGAPPGFGGGAPTGGPARPPTLLAGAEELTAQGVLDSVTGSPTRALSQLARAAALLESSTRAALLPDTPAALAALVAVQTGELDVARSLLERAVTVRLGGPAAAARHRLLLGWIALNRGAFASARGHLDAVGRDALEPRDELLASALEVALARRAGDLASLMPLWGRAREAIVRHPVDLFVLQPLGELAIAATRLREPSWVRPHLDEAEALLGRLGSPPLWAAPLHWARLHAAILTEDREEAAAHAAALQGAACGSRFAEAMAVAAPHWVALLDSRVDPAAVEAAARGLHAVGLSWDGGKLAGQAAIRTDDRKAMSALLTCARALQGQQAPPAPARPQEPGTEQTGAPAGPPVEDEPADGQLSDREREVAALVLEGLTYKQIGEKLFISAKTVEHHVARMRQRLGSTSRGELFAQLKRIVG